jgi:sensor c-di-GMP phosphodiesterase-like protein
VGVRRGISRKNLVAIVLGVILGGAATLAFDHWVSQIAERDNAAHAAMAAQRAIELADGRVSQVITALDDLVRDGVTSCTPDHVEEMRKAAFAVPPIKGVGLLRSDGTLACQRPTAKPMDRTVLSNEPLPGAPGYSIDVVQFRDNLRMVRLSRKIDNTMSIAAVISGDMFVPMLTAVGPFGAHARMTTANGAVLGESGVIALGPKPSRTMSVARRFSQKYGFQVVSTQPIVSSDYSDLTGISLFVKIAVSAGLIAFALVMPRRNRNNPVAELERALDAGEFVPFYQPIVDIRSGQLRGAEVLMRWRKDDGSLVLPGSFIPLAESTGLILPMTRALMRKVCAEMGAAIGCRPGLKVSFNFAAQLFRDESIVKEVRSAFANSPVDLSQVVLELTERDPIENLTETRRVIAALQGIGVRIAIDDVGTGHSGLSYMLKLGVDIIKIDKMFVDSIGTDRNSTTIVETLVDLAHNMRMDIVAEGVESFDQVVHLRDLGIRSAQGYVFSPPLPGGAFLKLVEAIDPLPAAAMEGRVAGAARRYMSARSRFNAA